MTIISHHLQTVVKAARVVAGMSFLTFAVAAALLLASFNGEEATHAVRSTRFQALFVSGLAGAYVVPGVLMWVMAGRLEAGKPWAFAWILVSTALEVPKFVVGFSLPCVGIPLRLPAVYLGACCLNAWPDARDLYRQRRRARQPRGFEPIMTAARPAPLPPPPARSLRTRALPVEPPAMDEIGSKNPRRRPPRPNQGESPVG